MAAGRFCRRRRPRRYSVAAERRRIERFRGRRRTRSHRAARHLGSALCAVSFVVFLGALSHFLTLDYPKGVLQTALDIHLPWPLQ